MNPSKKIHLYFILFVLGIVFGVVGTMAGTIMVASKKMEQSQSIAMPIEYRDDAYVVFGEGIVERLNNEYDTGTESLYCLIGHVESNTMVVDTLAQGGTIERGSDYLVFDEDPPCQIPGSLGSLHTHPIERGCEPSLDDMFTFGEMHSPEPVINAIQCNTNEIHIFKMPKEREEFNFKRVRWE